MIIIATIKFIRKWSSSQHVAWKSCCFIGLKLFNIIQPYSTILPYSTSLYSTNGTTEIHTATAPLPSAQRQVPCEMCCSAAPCASGPVPRASWAETATDGDAAMFARRDKGCDIRNKGKNIPEVSEAGKMVSKMMIISCKRCVVWFKNHHVTWDYRRFTDHYHHDGVHSKKWCKWDMKHQLTPPPLRKSPHSGISSRNWDRLFSTIFFRNLSIRSIWFITENRNSLLLLRF